MNITGATEPLAAGMQDLEALRLKARNNPAESAAAVSKQFEAMFLGMVLKGMRATTSQDGPFDSEQTRLYTSMLDQQLAQHMARRGTGLAEVMTRQLSGSVQRPADTPAGEDGISIPDPAPSPAAAAATAVTTGTVPRTQGALPAPASSAGDFVRRIWSHAAEAAQAVGVRPQFIAGQAALESGWGRHEIRTADGQPSHNLFGIKAGANWKGPSVEKATVEYVDGVAMRTTDRFRVYASYSEAFSDYANLLRGNSRYSAVLGQGDARLFAQGLSRGGYATDPAYADKLVGAISTAHNLAFAGAGSTATAVSAHATRDTGPAAAGLMHAAYSGGNMSAGHAQAIISERKSAMTARLDAAVAQQAGRRAEAAAPVAAASRNAQPADFVNRVWPHALEAAQAAGLRPQFVLGQAALETGWGRHELRTADGQSAHNLFRIKAGADWTGPVVEKAVTEYVNGSPAKVMQKFRVYESYSDGLRDYAKMLRDSPRYSKVVGQANAAGYADVLQRGGYATDPAYADKLVRVINSPVIRQALAETLQPRLLARR